MWSLIKSKAGYLVALAVFLLMLLLVLYIVAKNTDAYDEAARFVSEDARIVASIGTVQKTSLKFWDGFEFTGNNANFSIEATSEKGTFVVDVHVRRVGGAWRVDTAEIRGRDGGLTS